MSPNDVDKFVKSAKHWGPEMAKLRALLLKTKLEEKLKWSQPCYTLNGGNVVIIQPFKNFLALMFFKGKLLKDPKKILIDNGPNSQSAKRLEFQATEEITAKTAIINAYVKEAIALEESGAKVETKKRPDAIPEELKIAFAKNVKLKKAFEALTPGRQRAYLIHFSGAKQSETRAARIAKCAPAILAGKGMMDR